MAEKDSLHHRLYEPLDFSGAPWYSLGSLETLFRETEGEYASDWITLDVDYQRERVWTTAQQAAYMGFLLSGGRLQPLVVNVGLEGIDHPARLMDGKQRITAALAWLRDEIYAEPLGFPRFRISELTEYDRKMFLRRAGFEFGRVRLDREGELRLYLKLNGGGTPHTAAELSRVEKLLLQERRRKKDDADNSKGTAGGEPGT